MIRRTAVTVDDDTLDVVDLVLLGTMGGEWPAFERRVATGLALERQCGEGIAKAQISEAATEFRYANRLISAADFLAWLKARQMTLEEFSGVLRRRLLVSAHESRLPEGDEDIATVLAPEAYTDGILGRLADRALELLVAGRLAPVSEPPGADAPVEQALAVRAPGIAALGPVELRRRLTRLLALENSLIRLREQVAEPDAIARRIKNHALEWLELHGDELRFEREGAAREARLLIAVDGETPAQVAQRAEVAVLDRRLLVDQAPPRLAVSFAASAEGEVIGPWEQDGCWHVMRLRGKVKPSADDARLRERAIDELLAERIERHAAGRTTRLAEL